MILVVDNYDSFVHNLARYVREAGAETLIVRNDARSVRDLVGLRPAGVILSPGPNSPREAGVCLEYLSALAASTPVLGVCLGHQCLIEAFGGRTVRARRPLHGEAAPVRHDGSGLHAGLPDPFSAGRYHALIGELGDAQDLVANAWSEEGEIMGVRRGSSPWHGVQYHPESLLTTHGRRIVEAFLRLTKEAGAA